MTAVFGAYILNVTVPVPIPLAKVVINFFFWGGGCREDLLLLDAVEMFGYGNWKDIARHVESKNEQQVKERYIKRFINGAIGIHTWKEDLRLVDMLRARTSTRSKGATLNDSSMEPSASTHGRRISGLHFDLGHVEN
jgi:hypothetical protein